ncbi:MAG TPA: hypothetical protein VM661_11600 [Candidatus Sulfotelmatobacter sp.]|jgi:hypothetical protein|nr:hypothetical protein [Candidatus Sulfotelmatobacter sp.]
MSNDETITYRFHLAEGVHEIPLRFDAADFSLIDDHAEAPPDWARLENHQCGHCPLSTEQSPFCPMARAMAGYIETFDRFYSYEEAVIEVVTKNRTVVGKMALQRGMASLVGLIGATSGCPHLAFFRAMARFHLPFARDDETLYRVFSMYLLMRHIEGWDVPPGEDAFAGLQDLSRAATLVNRCMAERIRAAFAKDVVINAIIVLDSFAQAVPFVIEEKLTELRTMFVMPKG